MSDLDDLIMTVNKLCLNLDRVSEQEKFFSDNIRCELERMCWESLRMANDLKQIKEYCGGYV
jgi:hypothetical protein